MTLLARILIITAALSLIVAIILKLAQAVFPVADLSPVAFMRFTDTSLLFAIALMMLVVMVGKAKA